jgi:hypothetical protein
MLGLDILAALIVFSILFLIYCFVRFSRNQASKRDDSESGHAFTAPDRDYDRKRRQRN